MAVLGVKVLLVLGHTSCGAVTAAMTPADPPGQIRVLYHRLQPAVEQSRGVLRKAIEINAGLQADVLRGSSSVIRDAIQAGQLRSPPESMTSRPARMRLRRGRPETKDMRASAAPKLRAKRAPAHGGAAYDDCR